MTKYTTQGIPYPEPTDPFNLVSDLMNRALAVNTLVESLQSADKALTTLANSVTFQMPSGWRNASSVSYRKLGKLVFLEGWIGQEGYTTAGRHQNVFTLPTAIWPLVDRMVPCPALGPGNYNASTVNTLHFKASGQVDLHVAAQTRYTYLHGIILVTK